MAPASWQACCGSEYPHWDSCLGWYLPSDYKMSSPIDTPYTRTLQRAADTLGGYERLARALGVTLAQLRLWTTGVEVPPIEVFTAALDIVAAGRTSGARS